MDSSIAIELFVAIFSQLYLHQEDKREVFEKSVTNILERSTQNDYSTIQGLHRVAIEFHKETGFRIDPQLIADTGTKSMNFQTAIVLEEALLATGASASRNGKKAKRDVIEVDLDDESQDNR